MTKIAAKGQEAIEKAQRKASQKKYALFIYYENGKMRKYMSEEK